MFATGKRVPLIMIKKYKRAASESYAQISLRVQPWSLLSSPSLSYSQVKKQGEGKEKKKKSLLNSLFIITLRARAVPPGDSLEFPARRHGAGSRCQLRKAEEEREEVV
jgi:hypothetical protein